MSVCVAAAASFLTPVASPVNLMMGTAGYKFGDYWKLALPCMIRFFIRASFTCRSSGSSEYSGGC
jgi:di/tricarboxylate transporter